MRKDKQSSQSKSGLKRREFLKSLTTIPVFGGFIAAFMAKQIHDQTRKDDIFAELGIKTNFDSDITVQSMKPGKQIRLGIIGVGNRGTSILEALGFNVPKESYQDVHDDLNILVTGICDVYNEAAERGLVMSRENRNLKETARLPKPTRYNNYQEMLKSKDIDAVTSASDQYFARQGLIYTYKGGKKVNVTYLHLKDWLNCIRDGGEPCCNIDLAVEDTITCLMATKSYQEKRRVIWDAKNGIVV